jgi:hypothetical protein
VGRRHLLSSGALQFEEAVCRSSGPQKAVCGPVDTHLADACALTKHRNVHIFLPSHMHPSPRYGPWATCIRRSRTKVESEFPAL